MCWVFCHGSLSRRCVNRVLAPEGELLSFASPKESIQRKGDPDSACFLRFSLLARVFGRAILSPPKTSGIPAAPLSGNSRQKLRCSGRNNGNKTIPSFGRNPTGLIQLQNIGFTDFRMCINHEPCIYKGLVGVNQLLKPT